MSLLLTYLSRKALIAENLQSMGVNAANSNNGLTTLAGKILDIEPSVSGLNIETSINLRSSTDTSFVGQSITFEAEVIVTYDDETATDVDLSGVLTGATIIFKNGDNILGTGITDANGIATYTCAFNTMGNHFITATFEGTDNFVGCTSSSINVSTNYDIIISSNKSILSYAHNDTATINCLLNDGLGGKSGETLSYEILNTDDKVIDSGSGITNSSGEVNFTYNSCGIGDITIVVYYGNSFQKEINIEDYNFYSNDGTGLTGNYSTNVGYISNIQSDTYIDTTFPQIWEMSFEFYRPSTVSNRALLFSIGQDSNNCKLIGYNTNNTGSEKDLQIYNRSSGSNSNCQKTTTPDYNNEEWTSAKITFNGSKIIFEVGSTVLECNDNYATNIFKIYSNTYSYLKNIKVKALPSYNLSVTASDDIIQSGNTTTLTATLTDNSVPLTGETLSYEIKHGNTTISSGTRTTDNNGQATISYVGTGIGDVDVIVSYGSLEETYDIQDLLLYDNASVDKSSTTFGTPVNIRMSSNWSISHTNDSYAIYGSTTNGAVGCFPLAILSSLTEYTLEFDSYTTVQSVNTGITLGDNRNYAYIYLRSDKWHSWKTGSGTGSSANETSFDINGTTQNVWTHYVITRNGQNLNLKAYVGDAELCNQSVTINNIISDINQGFAYAYGGGANINIKNIKVKAL